MNRPDRLVLVTGTTTEIGKTWWTAALAHGLRQRGLTVAARKPVQSFESGDVSTDADVLATATGVTPDEVCPQHRWLGVAMAPPMAADVLGVEAFTIAELAAEVSWPRTCDVGFVEGVGGPRSPLASDGDTVDLARRLRPDLVVLVADAQLGTINAVLLGTEVIASQIPGTDVIVALNRYDDDDDLHRRNRAFLEGPLEVVIGPDELVERLA